MPWVEDHNVECYSLDPSLNIWVEFPSLDIGRGYATSVMTPSGWWIAGLFVNSFHLVHFYIKRVLLKCFLANDGCCAIFAMSNLVISSLFN